MPATAGNAHSSGRDYLLSWIDVGRIRYATSVAGEAFDKLSIPKAPRGLQASTVSPIDKYNQPSAETVRV